MNKCYNQLTELDRIFLRSMLDRNFSKEKIAEALGVHRSTIYREIKRNSITSNSSMDRVYNSMIAQDRYLKKRKRISKIQLDRDLREYIHKRLKEGWSPLQIAGRLKLENEGNCIISHETIYRYIYSNYDIRNRFYKRLRRKHFSRKKQNQRQQRVPKDALISNRPEYINERQEFGHWECDLMVFKRGIKSNLITLRERKTRFLIAIKNKDKTARGTAITLISTVKHYKPYIKSITFDQGSEFQKYTWIKDCLDTSIYFCNPSSPYQKGAVENANGVIRSELPRTTNLDEMNQFSIRRLIEKINDRPLKCLGFYTPLEVFTEAVRAL